MRRLHVRPWLLALGLLLAPHPTSGQDLEHTPFQIGVVNFFGYGGLDLPAIRAAVPLHAGDTLNHATFSKAPTAAAIQTLTGHAPTDINVTCCDGERHLLLYIGLPGTTSRPVDSARSFTGRTTLPAPGLLLYHQAVTALEQAVTTGDPGEDDSQGYALSKDPGLHQAQLKLRAYALTQTQAVLRVLSSARDAQQRRVAAELAGYIDQSPEQIRALTSAVQDPDSEVRNNAVRALEVLVSAKPFSVDPGSFIALLYSGQWTDRNKASLFLAHLTDISNEAVLNQLRREALPALVEGASWEADPGHSTPFAVVLGRIGHVPSSDLADLIARHDVATLANAARTGSYHPSAHVN